MAFPILIAKNNTAFKITIYDLEIQIAAGSSEELVRGGLYSLPDIMDNEQLQRLVESGDITLNDGTNDLLFSEFYQVGKADEHHAALHQTGGADEIDGNLIKIAFEPGTYQRLAGTGQATDLRAHFDGIDEQFAALELGSWQDSVKDKDLLAPPGSPAEGDRYIVPAAATGAWLGLDGKIVEWNGLSWVSYDPATGWATWAEDEAEIYVYDGANWTLYGGDYVLRDGSRAFSGNVDIGTNNIINVNLVDGVDVSAHAARHQPGGSDPISTGAPVAIGTANAAGTSTDLARADHQHDHGSQSVETHHALAVAGVSHGFLSSGDKTKIDSSGELTAAAPADVDKSAAAPGISTESARADHKHDISAAAPVAVGAANAEGTSTSLARADHVHNHGSQAGGTLHALAVAGVSAGFISAADQTKVNTLNDASYVLLDGTRAMTGSLDMGTFAITNVGNVDGVDISAHAARHISAGADEIDGDQLDIDWNPTNYSPTVAPAEVSSLDHLTAHLAGIDAAIGGAGVTDHGDLNAASLLDDDHTQYILVAGSRAFTGDQSMGGFKLTSVGTPTAGTDAANKDYVDGLIQGLDWQNSVLDKDLTAPPGAPTVGDRYIVAAPATGAWLAQEDAVAEWNGTAWVFETPNEGFASWVEDENVQYVWNGTGWVKLSSTQDHNSLLNLAVGDVHTQYQLRSEKGAANGYAPLDASAEISDATHGTRAGGTLHALANGTTAGFMSAAQFTQLSGLDDAKYFLIDGTRAMTGNIDVGTGNIVNVGTVDGVTVSAHAARHILAGPDEIDGDQLGITWNPANYAPTTAPAEATSLDHLTAHLAGIDAALATAPAVTIHPAAAVNPTGAASGDLYYNTSASHWFQFDGTFWFSVQEFYVELSKAGNLNVGQFLEMQNTIVGGITAGRQAMLMHPPGVTYNVNFRNRFTRVLWNMTNTVGATMRVMNDAVSIGTFGVTAPRQSVIFSGEVTSGNSIAIDNQGVGVPQNAHAYLFYRMRWMV